MDCLRFMCALYKHPPVDGEGADRLFLFIYMCINCFNCFPGQNIWGWSYYWYNCSVLSVSTVGSFQTHSKF